MSGHSVPDDRLKTQLAAEYVAAHYFVTIGHREWLFGIGQLATDIERELGAANYLFITAWNPAPRIFTPKENTAADERLRERLQDGGFRHHSAIGSNGQGGAVEYGWIVLDVPMATGDAWAREFDQIGILYWRRGEPVRLRMMCAQPAETSEHPHIDWAG